MSNEISTFEVFMKTRAEAADAYVEGNPEPLLALAATTRPATFFGPGGAFEQGVEAVRARYESDAKGFEAGGESWLEILQTGASGSVAYWVGFQRAKARLRDKPEPVAMTLRVTEVFRREGDAWKLVHRHAEMASPEGKKH